MSLEKNERAYGELIDRWQRIVISSAYSVTHDFQTAEDIAQESFLTAWIKLATLAEREKFGSWVSRIARNRAINSVTRTKREYNIEIIAEKITVSSPEDMFIRKETSSEITEAFGRLSDSIRETAVMYYLRNMTQRQISISLNVPEGTIKHRIFSARKKLKEELAGLFIRIERTDEMKEGTDMFTQNEFTEKILKRIDYLGNYYKSHSGTYEGYNEEYEQVEKMAEALEIDSEEKEKILTKVYSYKRNPDKEFTERLIDLAFKTKEASILCNALFEKHWNLDNYKSKIKFYEDEALPLLEKIGANEQHGRIKFWLGVDYHHDRNIEKAKEVFESVRTALSPNTEEKMAYMAYINAKASLKVIELQDKIRKNNATPMEMGLCSTVYCLKQDSKKTYLTNQPGYTDALDNTFSSGMTGFVLYYAMISDSSYLTDSMDEYIERTGETVVTENNVFSGCTKIRVSTTFLNGFVWYCPNVGIVKLEGIDRYKRSMSYEISSYRINGGGGLFPLHEGNFWSYKNQLIDSRWEQYTEYEVESFKDDSYYITEVEYVGGSSEIIESDVRYIMREADKKCEQFKFDEAIDLLKRAAMNSQTNEDSKMAEYAIKYLQKHKQYQELKWRLLPSHLISNYIVKHNGNPACEDNNIYDIGPYRFGTRWEENKIFGNKPLRYPTELTGYMFKDEWKENFHEEFVREVYGVKTDVSVTSEKCDAPITVRAGTFENCVKVTIVAHDPRHTGCYYFENNYSSVHCGTKIYWFAPDVGMIKHDCIWEGCLSSSTELSEYFSVSNTGEYMPVYVGNKWVYDEVTLEEKYKARVTLNVVCTDITGEKFYTISEQDFIYQATEEEYEEDKKNNLLK